MSDAIGTLSTLGFSGRSGRAKGFPFTYAIAEVTEAGDSGGPAFAAGTHVVVGVESGGIPGTDLVARVDLVASWIRGKVASTR